ncbi:Integrator complex subunit 12 [Dermatophagoides pteronyssinus]|uniref:Integrator complex subunit 12 n=1 Tax=Dermatophagoides pteronyssinus TaxID=6956 RepID=A0ABQ8JIK5_DERPT|nr:Integrator complex subunit 12 [Dermatophagoides pteronyssinus]
MEIETEDFIKGLRLLHSRSPESSDELKKLLDFYHAKKMNFNLESRRPKDTLMNAFSSLQSLNQGLRTATAGEDKKQKTLEEDSEATDIEDNEAFDSNNNDSSTTNIIHNNQCIVCRQGESTVNRLLECHECRLCFHPECHKPIVSKKELNDPRSIWYCFKCKNVGRKMQKTSIISAANSGKVIIDPNKVVTNTAKSSLDTIKRSNKIATTQSTQYHPILKANSSTIGGTATGISPSGNQSVRQQSSTMATNLTNKTKSNIGGSMHTAASSNAGATYNNNPTPSSNLMNNLDKRLANMKKTKSGSKFS